MGGQTATAGMGDMGIVLVGITLVNERLHTLASTHSLEEIEESHLFIGCHNLLIAYQRLDTGHRMDAFRRTLVTVGHTDNEDTGLGIGCLEMADNASHLMDI